MNCTQLQEVWDTCCDDPAALSPAQRAAFELHLQQCPRCHALWQVESAWLKELGSTPTDTLSAPEQFCAAVLAQWQGAAEVAPDPRSARRAWLGLVAWSALATAAAVALAVLVALPPVRAPNGGHAIAVRGPDPVGQLVVALHRATIPTPTQLLDDLRETGAQLAQSLNQALTPGDLTFPDPTSVFLRAPASAPPAPHGRDEEPSPHGRATPARSTSPTL